MDESGEDIVFTMKDNNHMLKKTRKIANTDDDKEYYEYHVKGHETLMLLSFELYSDFRMWKSIARDNALLVKDGYDLKKGMVLKIKKTLRPLIQPVGFPYLVKENDTLGKISDKVYGQVKHWGKIYLNNLNLIKDPNLIYSGITLFYKALDEFKAIEIAKK